MLSVKGLTVFRCVRAYVRVDKTDNKIANCILPTAIFDYNIGT